MVDCSVQFSLHVHDGVFCYFLNDLGSLQKIDSGVSWVSSKLSTGTGKASGAIAKVTDSCVHDGEGMVVLHISKRHAC